MTGLVSRVVSSCHNAMSWISRSVGWKRIGRNKSMIAGNLTKYPDVNEIIDFFVRGVFSALGENVLGIYLTGSLSHGAFNYHSSDIDITVIVHRPVSRSELNSIRTFTQRDGREIREMGAAVRVFLYACRYAPMCYAFNGASTMVLGW